MLVLLLCDGGGPIGVGHVIRSLALAEAAIECGLDDDDGQVGMAFHKVRRPIASKIIGVGSRLTCTMQI